MSFLFGVIDPGTNAGVTLRNRDTTLTMQRISSDRNPELDFYEVGNLPAGHQAYIEQDPPGWRVRLWVGHQEALPVAHTLYSTANAALRGLEHQLRG